ncbi:glycosyltransferase family 4 protein [Thiohalomonas denitrificans]|uniref:Glycosyltransferase involved in cell wall bisynthesis n=1 Tax=Thiohalomonas denitrificans TaxID=415747 RepID=A0A1G5QZM1_9GAMM|nr:glycosyltransferase family 4 protein [Thiohalomonas denitrificans]SCZ67222.1 Glycosyltransferase involved in cell wall bisynthesis [Thiohalomonas denitrificans]
MAPPKLLYFVTEDWYFCSHRLPLAVAARDAGYDVAVVTRVRDHGETIRAAGIRVIALDSERRSLNPLSLASSVGRLAALYRRERPDIVHHVALKPVVLGAVAARLAGVKRVVSALAGLGWLYSSKSRAAALLGYPVRRVLKGVLSRGRIIVQNPDDLAWLCALGVSQSSMTLIRGSGVDVAQFHPGAGSDGIPVVVLVARMLWDKGVGELVEASRRIHQRGGTARFVLVGAPDAANPGSIDEATLKAWADEGTAEWWGRRDDMVDVLDQAHIACLPSYYGEGVPRSLLEAAAAGLPIVTTDAPGCREVVIDGDNGLLVPPRDVDALADALEALIQDPDRRREMGLRSRERAEKEFSIDKVVSETLAIYREMLV